jgi:Rapamycin-insensitive companion of mTOR, N-term
VSLDNEMERIQAILLLRKMIRLGNVATSVINAIVAIVAEGGEERERMSRICLETLCELGKSSSFQMACFQEIYFSVLYCPQHPNIVSALRVLMEFLLESNCVPLTKAVVAVICHFSARAQNDIPAKFCDITVFN